MPNSKSENNSREHQLMSGIPSLNRLLMILEAQVIARYLLQENDIQTNTISIGTKDKVLVPFGTHKNKSIGKEVFHIIFFPEKLKLSKLQSSLYNYLSRKNYIFTIQYIVSDFVMTRNFQQCKFEQLIGFKYLKVNFNLNLRYQYLLDNEII